MRISDEKLTDRLAISILTWFFPPEAVERAIAHSGRMGARNRLLPPKVVVYFVLAMCMFPAEGYSDVARLLAEGMALGSGACQERRHKPLHAIPTTAAISRARMRLGSAPLEALFDDTVAREAPAAPALPGATFPQLRRRVLDGRIAVLPPSPENAAAYAPERVTSQSRVAQPGIRVTVLADNDTGTLLGADLSHVQTSLPDVTKDLVSRVGKGDLLLADGDYARPLLWRRASGTGAELLWSVPDWVRLPQIGGPLGDNSYLSLLPSRDKDARPTRRDTVRVLAAPPGGQRRLMTSILDPAAASAEQLRQAYAGHWTFEQAADQLDTMRAGRPHSVRSRSPETARQEIWGHLLVYSAIRSLANNRVS